MRGSSRASLAEAKERLAEILGGGGRISPDRLGEELFAVAGLLDSEPGLRRTLSDPAREGRAKAGLAETLLGGKISASALNLVSTLVSALVAARGPGRRGRAARRAGHHRGRRP